MNNPLRYNGETFYQSGFGIRQKTGDPQTTLTVVANRGWMIPYIGCMIVAVGLLSHFLSVLGRFCAAGRAARSIRAAGPMAKMANRKFHWPNWPATRRRKSPGCARLGEFFPWITVAILVGWAWSHAVPPRSTPASMDLYKFGELPVVYEGRPKPFDTLARNVLKAISERQTWVDNDGHRHPAVEWLLDVVTDPDVAANEPVFHIDDKDLLDILGLTPKLVQAEETVASIAKIQTPSTEEKAKLAAARTLLAHQKDNRYAIVDFRDGLKAFGKEWKHADETAEAERNPVQRQIVGFAKRLGVYHAVQDSFQPLDLPPLPTPEEVKDNRDAAMATAMEIGRMIKEDMPRFHDELAKRQVPLSVPPEKASGEWQPFATAIDLAFIDRVIHGSEGNPNTVASGRDLPRLCETRRESVQRGRGQIQRFADGGPAETVDRRPGRQARIRGVFQPFRAILLRLDSLPDRIHPGRFALLGWSVPLNRAAFWLVATTLVLHTAAMIGRIYISGRPPVTNLYSAALFIGWAGVGLGLLLELFYRLGIGTMIAALAGFMTLLIADFLAKSGDTFTVMQAVLDTQFWLATHVVCITLGYATTFIAGLLGVRYVDRRRVDARR